MDIEVSTLESLETLVWQTFLKSLHNRRKGFHYLNIATVDALNRPSVRTVILRRVETSSKTICFHTDARSRKVLDWQHNPNVQVHVYDMRSQLQVSMRVKVSMYTLSEKAKMEYQKLSPGAKALYAKVPAPMTILPCIDQNYSESDIQLNPVDGFANFVWVEAHAIEMEVLLLQRKGHVKAIFTYEKCVASKWVQP